MDQRFLTQKGFYKNISSHFAKILRKPKVKRNDITDACSQPAATQQKNSTSPYAFMNLNNSIIPDFFQPY